MSLSAFNNASCQTHGDSLHAYGKCVRCHGVVRPTTKIVYDRLDKKKAIVRRKAFHVFATGRPRSLGLTDAEKRVAKALLAGCKAPCDISAVARVHVDSVSRLIQRAMERIGVQSREALVDYVREMA